jgi:NADH:ubiquinone oxidoreductase subunit E
MNNLELKYVFQPMSDGKYQVKLCGEFVCYSNHTDEEGIDQVLKEMGYASRGEFLNESEEERKRRSLKKR